MLKMLLTIGGNFIVMYHSAYSDYELHPGAGVRIISIYSVGSTH